MYGENNTVRGTILMMLNIAQFSELVARLRRIKSANGFVILVTKDGCEGSHFNDHSLEFW